MSVVLADGCFDCLHVGHLRYLRAAAAFGSVTVRVAPDSEIRRKGREPFQTQAERAELIAAIKGVDAVSIAATLIDAILTDANKYSVVVKGVEWRGQLQGALINLCDEKGIRIVFVDTNARRSTERLRA